MLTSMYAFARRPRWVLSHALVAGGIVAMVGLGFWQLDRLDQRQTRNGEVTNRLAQPITDLGALVSPTDGFDVGEDLRFRLATATGEYQPADEVLILNRTFKGAPGYWAFTPLLREDGTAVVVNRGWVPFTPGPGEPRPGTEPPVGSVSVVGMVRETVIAEGLQSAGPAAGVLAALARPDLARLEAQLDYDILPVYLQLESQQPEGTDLPFRLPRPQLGEGPHLGYAVQWFIFAIIGLAGYPLVLRKVARSEVGDKRHSDIPVDYL